MKSALLVPMHVDALHLPRPVSAADPTVDFRALPWIARDADGLREVTPERPFLSETVLSEPMSLSGNMLGPGVHLNWALPTALATGRHPEKSAGGKVDAQGSTASQQGETDRDRIEFPPVPDRWLVCRWRGETLTAAWLVESDYLWAADEDVAPESAANLTTWPHRIVQAPDAPPRFEVTPETPPWRYIGRKRRLGRPWSQRRAGSRLSDIGERLTAIGFGETNFAAFYPNCRSVFGLHDPDTDLRAEDSYEVFGWYADAALDPIQRTRAALGRSASGAALRDALGDRYRWTWDPAAAGAAGPDGVLCYGRVYQPGCVPPAPREIDDLVMAIGSNSTEALLALMVDKLAAERRKGDVAARERERDRLEDVLDALCLADKLPEREVDIGAELEMARYQRGFRAVDGSPIWVVRLRQPPGAKAIAKGDEGITLPAALAFELDALNAAEQAYGAAVRCLDADRDQLYADWYRAMRHSYTDDELAPDAGALRGGLAHDLDVDDLVGLLRQRVADLGAAQLAAGELLSADPADRRIRAWARRPDSLRLQPVELELRDPPQGQPDVQGVWTAPRGATLPPGATETLAARLVACRAALQGAIETHNRDVAKQIEVAQAARAVDPGQGTDPGGSAQPKTPPPSPPAAAAGWELAGIPGPRFWLPTEPVVLLSGPSAPDLARHALGGTERHDEAGRLVCLPLAGEAPALAALGTPDAAGERRLAEALTGGSLRAVLDAAAKALGFDPQAPGGPRPFLLEWKAALAPAVLGGSRRAGAETDFAEDYIQRNWALGETGYDLRAGRSETIERQHQGTVVGRSVLGRHADAAVRTRLEAYILGRLSQPIHRKTPSGDRTEKSWFESKGIPYDQRRVDRSAFAELRAWAQRVSDMVEADAAAVALEQMQTVLTADARGTATFIHGILPDGAVARALVAVVAGAASRPEPVAGLVALGLDQAAADVLAARFATKSPAGLAELDEALAAGPTAPDRAAIFARLLRATERQGGFGIAGRSNFPFVNGLPDGGGIAAAVVRLANTLDGTQMDQAAHLAAAARDGILQTREGGAIRSLLGLAAIPGVTPGTLGRLLLVADRQGRLGQGGAGAAEGADSGQGAAGGDDAVTDAAGHHAVDALVDALDAWDRLDRLGPTISQSLGGLYDALLMRRGDWQLPVADPMGFEDYRIFYEHVVREAIGPQIRRSPRTENPYMPILGGELRLVDLNLVDLFGQVQSIAPRATISARGIRRPGTTRTRLDPRILQAARLNLRWLAAGGDAEEWNSHPASSPICGWLVVDSLDGSILLFDQAGTALGSVDRLAHWNVAPGARGPVRPEDIDNPWLRGVAAELCAWADPEAPAGGDTGASIAQFSSAATRIERFGGLVESALESIDPSSIDSEDTRALLFSRPVAVVRITASIELREPPRPRQGMGDLAAAARGRPPRTDAFEQVRVPLRIGEHQRLSDGVVGYWLVDARGRLADRILHAPQSAWLGGESGAAGPRFDVYREKDAPLVHWIAPGETIRATVLFDPRGALHATTGILPAKRIGLPPDQYLAALGRLQVSFLTAPILTPAGEIQVPLRAEPGWSWSWIAREAAGFVRLPTRPVLHRDAFRRAFPPGRAPGADAIWGRLVAAGVIEAIPGSADQGVVHTERLIEAFKRKPPDPNAIPAELQADIRRVVETSGRRLAGPPGTVDFTPRELREGWLTLTPNPASGGSGAAPTPAPTLAPTPAAAPTEAPHEAPPKSS